MMMRSKVIACFLCLTFLTGAVRAQETLPSNSDNLKRKIDSVKLIYRSTVLRHYDELIASLEKDIEDLTKVRELGGTPEAVADINAKIKQLTKVRANAATARALVEQSASGLEPSPSARAADAEMAHSLPPAARDEQAATQPTPSPSPVGAPLPCHCQVSEDAKQALPAGLIWCKSVEDFRKWNFKLSAQTLAEYAAPILWFSPDEPLRKEGRKLPEPLPGDEVSINAKEAVVYYRISEVLRKRDGFKSELDIPDNLELNQVKGLALKYYFYYSRDKGFHGHLHDLESVRLDIQFTLRDRDGKKVDNLAEASYYVAHISRVIGAAHGVTWYGNQLDIGDGEKDTSLPITLLVEEGKHATSPDRNADGFYSPGYDVNKRYTDAWGVRDLIGSGQLGSAKYEGSMTKPRIPEDMIMVKPSAVDASCLLNFYTGKHKDELEKKEAAAAGYNLKPAREGIETDDERVERVKQEKANLTLSQRLRYKDTISGWMEGEKFSEVKPREMHGESFFERLYKKGFGIKRKEELKDALPIAYRLEGRQHGFTILPPVGRYQVPFLLSGYLMPKINVMFPGTRVGAIPGRKLDRQKRFSLEALYTPSAARTFDWYSTAGLEWARPEPTLGYVSKFVTEGGLRFRVNAGSWLLGGRVGLRVTGFAEARQPRFIFELGTGAF